MASDTENGGTGTTSFRLQWVDVPTRVKAVVEDWLGCSVASISGVSGGFTPGLAASMVDAKGRRFFIKAAGPHPNPTIPATYLREGSIAGALPPGVPAPRLLWGWHDLTPWVVLVFAFVDGHTPLQPWIRSELAQVTDAIVALSHSLTPCPVAASLVPDAGAVFATAMHGWDRIRDEGLTLAMDPWLRQHLDLLVAVEATAADAARGDTLLHFDLRADNMLLTPDGVRFVDWPLACRGAAWIDIVLFAPTVALQGGPSPEAVIMCHPAVRDAPRDAITAVIVAFAGFLTHSSMLPPEVGFPTMRGFQAALATVTRRWAGERLGLAMAPVGRSL